MGKKINILILADVLQTVTAGTERHIVELCKRIDKEQYTLFVACLSDRFALSKEIEECGVRTLTLSIRRIYGLSAFIKSFQFRKFLKKEDIDIVTTYHFGSDIWGTLVAKTAGVPCIISNRRDEGFWRAWSHVAAYRFINQWVDKIVVVSQAVKKMVLSEGVEPGKIELIVNGVDLAIHARARDHTLLKQELRLPHDAIIIACVGNLRMVKGHEFLIKAASAVVRRYPAVYFMFVGEGELRGALERQAAALRLEKHILFLGRRRDIPELLSVADICVLPSLSEGFSNVLLEYMASGKPVIATETGGNPDVINNGVNGYLVAKGSAEVLSDKLFYLLGRPEECARLGKQARQDAQKFSVESMIGHYQRLWEGKKTETISFRTKARRKLKIVVAYCLFYSGLLHIIRYILRKKVTVLCYHHVVESLENEMDRSVNGLLVTQTSFALQMSFLKKNYHIISMADFISYIEGKKSLPAYSLLVTFDDGYRSMYSTAYPILRKYDVPAAVFLTPGFVDGQMSPAWERNNGGRDRFILNWTEIEEMSKDSVYFGAHTVSHVVYGPEDTVVESAYKEISDSKTTIERRIKKEVSTFAFPCGLYNSRAIEEVKQAGFAAAFALDRELVRGVADENRPFTVQRIPINEGMYTDHKGKAHLEIFACALIGLRKKK